MQKLFSYSPACFPKTCKQKNQIMVKFLRNFKYQDRVKQEKNKRIGRYKNEQRVKLQVITHEIHIQSNILAYFFLADY